MKRCFIFAAGTFYGLRERPAPGDLVIAADAGYRVCQQAGIVPDLLLGDFDSMDQPDFPNIRRSPVEKDDTDTMLAVKTALEEGLPTIAVMATGIDRLYPPANRGLGESIAATPGCGLITDYPPGTDAIRINFLRRNRIIAGIAGSTVLIESKIKGGGMMTARLASSYGRDVYALPGRLDDPMSQGCNLLIRETLAVPVGDMGIFMNDLGLGKPATACAQDFREGLESFYGDRLSPEELQETLRTALKIKSSRGISLDELCRCLKVPFSGISRITTMLQCDGFIEIDLLQHCSIVPVQRGIAR